jgi:serine/threonine protein kinase
MSELKQLSRYQIQSHLGTGAFADVYRAIDTVLDREVALKVLKPMLVADVEAFGRFTREARTLANLMHPRIAWVWDLGEAEGRYFIAMRYVDGKSLDKAIAESGALAWEPALKITAEIGEALQFAHAKGLVHRDVKPQNIILSASEGAVLTDFGLVKAMNQSGMTTLGGFLGTPNYMAPELWADEDATPASDQYALACVLVEMLTGRKLYDSKTPLAVMAKHNQPPALPEKWPATVAPDLSAILLHALAQKPQERFADVRAFIFALYKPITVPAPVSQTGNQPIRMENSQTESCPLFAVQGPPDNPAGIEWVEIPAGEFLYGDKEEKQSVQNPYMIGKSPVTNAQYKRFLDANPEYEVPSNWDSKKRIYPAGKENHPVVHVNWNDAQAFCQWAGCRLPDEVEWEKAARGTDGRTFPWGKDWLPGKYCNSAEAKIGRTTPVDKFPEGASPYGVMDMSGNVWEWTSSIHGLSDYVIRGGSWFDLEDFLHSAGRDWGRPDLRGDNLGFRCARPSP